MGEQTTYKPFSKHYYGTSITQNLTKIGGYNLYIMYFIV